MERVGVLGELRDEADFALTTSSPTGREKIILKKEKKEKENKEI